MYKKHTFKYLFTQKDVFFIQKCIKNTHLNIYLLKKMCFSSLKRFINTCLTILPLTELIIKNITSILKYTKIFKQKIKIFFLPLIRKAF